jgi:predicted nucleic acid-binding protein
MSIKSKLNDRAVVDSSCLITLFKAKMDFILPDLFRQIIVPKAVWKELSVYNDISLQKLLEANWINQEKIVVNSLILLWNLGQGESEVLSMALDNDDFIAVVDDLAARRCAASLDIPYIGTVGILVLANRFKLIPSLPEALKQIKIAGLYLKEELIENIIKRES